MKQHVDILMFVYLTVTQMLKSTILETALLKFGVVCQDTAEDFACKLIQKLYLSCRPK